MAKWSVNMPKTQFIKRNKSAIFSFLLPFALILITIITSSLMVNHLKNIQRDSVVAIYNWEKLHSYASDRYSLIRMTSTQEYQARIETFNQSMYQLGEALPRWIFWNDMALQIEESIKLWQYIEQSLATNERTYTELIQTNLGKHLQENKVSEILVREFIRNGDLTQFDQYSFFLFNKVETEFGLLLDYISSEAFFEKKLLGLVDSLERVVNVLISILLIMSILISLLVMASVFRNIKNKLQDQQRNEESLSRILNSIGDGMIVLSTDQEIVKMNPIAEKLLAVNFAEQKSTDLFQTIFQREKTDSLSPFFKAKYAESSAVYQEEMIVKNMNGIDINISSSISPIFDVDQVNTGIVFVFQDITKRKQQEMELIQHKENLEALVQQRTEKLQQSLNDLKITQKQLIESEKMSSLASLVAGIAHEINTPVGIAVTAASILLQDSKELDRLMNADALTKSKLQQFSSNTIETSIMLHSNLQRAARLIQSFKQVAVDQSSEEKRDFELGSYIKEIILSTSSKFKNTSHTVVAEYAEAIQVKSYPGAIAQILTNLILNSLTHGFENKTNGVITIKVKKDSEWVIIDYVDTGSGIADAHIGKIFDPFFTTKRGVGGSGLGMNIVYNLVTQTLKGDISCDSIVGQGTHFNIRFPHNITT